MKTLALLMALVATGTAQAAMLCARPRSDGTFSATVKIREACRPNEVELGIVTLDPLRLFGPTTTSSTATTSTSTTSTSSTSSSSTTIPCPGGGAWVGSACWYSAGVVGNNCNDTCAAVGLAYNEATRTFAGSDGTMLNCYFVADAVVAGGVPNNYDEVYCGTARGCSVIDLDGGLHYSAVRCVNPPTTAAATGEITGFAAHNVRLCACS